MTTPLAKVGRLLLELHSGCRAQPTHSFESWAVTLIKDAIPFDACFWGSGAQLENEIAVHTYWFQNIPLEAMHGWEQIKHEDKIFVRLAQQPNVVHNITNEELRTEYELTYRFYNTVGIEQFLGAYFLNPSTGLYDAISLYRSNPASPFSEEERCMLECLIPHLVEARRANHLNWMNLTPEAGQMVCGYLASTDAKGILHASEEGFAVLLEQEWPQWRGPRLPRMIVDQLGSAKRHVGASVTLDFSRAQDMYLLRIRLRSAIDSLTPRQLQIAQSFADGKSYKQIGKIFDIAPSTVRNHINAIYQTLGINGKAELATLLVRVG